MEGSDFGGQMGAPITYDYRLHDRIWQRVSPELTPYPQMGLEEQRGEEAAEESLLPGAQRDPCCMGSEAADSAGVLEGFVAGELAERQCYLSLACNVSRRDVQRLLRCMAEEKRCAARQMRAALYLITGTCRESTVTVEPMRWRCLVDALRSCYHQEACGGFNYLRAVDGAADPCLQKLLRRLGEESWRRAEAVMSLLGQIIDKQ